MSIGFKSRLCGSAFVSLLVIALSVTAVTNVKAQELGGAGTVQGTIKDPVGGVMAVLDVTLSNPVTGFQRTTQTDATGKYVFRNLPPNPYHLKVVATGFQTAERDVDVRSAVPIEVNITLSLAGTTAAVSVTGKGSLVETDPTAHTDIDQSVISKLPVDVAGGLNQVVMLASPGVVADSNSFFHPIGDHAQTQFSIDNQPVTDQQSRVYSNQLSSDAVQSMEVITGVAPAEYGDKSSLVVHIITKSGLGQPKPTGSLSFGYGSFKSPTFEANVGAGSRTIGDFLSVSGLTTDRYLDPPEFAAIHDHGNQQSFFNRLDFHPGDATAFHLDTTAGRSSFDVPNTLDTPDQRQHQTIDSFNVAPGYSRVIGLNSVFTANGFVRRDKVLYSPSADPFADLPASVSQNRSLTNIGVKADWARTSGPHNFKVGASVGATKLNENFTLGFTDPAFNSPCLDGSGIPVGDPMLTSAGQCAGLLSVNPDFNSALVPFDLSRNGSPFVFNGAKTIKEQAAYAQDDITAGNVSLKLGVRFDHYDGLTAKSLVQPRLGVWYSIPASRTVLRASFGRTLETPYNENLLLSAGFGASGGLVGEGQPPAPGVRNQGELGIQQALGNWFVVDFGYFNKHTTNGYDFGVLFDTPIAFPVAWDHSRINGFTGRLNLVEHGGFSAFVVMAHTNAIFSPPGVGGVLLEEAAGDFRIDHDQKFNATTNVQYAFDKTHGAWVALSWRYDSGLVAGSVPDFATALTLTGDQQAAIGLFCGGVFATPDAPITDCAAANRGATRLVIPADGTEDDVTNPPRIAPRHLFDLGVGVDNLFNSHKTKVKVRLSVVNLTNKIALYNFLSTFSGTHFVTPRAVQFQVGIAF